MYSERRERMPYHACKLTAPGRLSTEAALLVDFAQLPLQFRDHLIDALLGLGVRRLSRQVPIFHDLHFEFYSLVF
jgi:hypothetical protein